LSQLLLYSVVNVIVVVAVVVAAAAVVVLIDTAILKTYKNNDLTVNNTNIGVVNQVYKCSSLIWCQNISIITSAKDRNNRKKN